MHTAMADTSEIIPFLSFMIRDQGIGIGFPARIRRPAELRFPPPLPFIHLHVLMREPPALTELHL